MKTPEAMQTELDELKTIVNTLRLEKEIYKERGEHWQRMCQQAYQLTSDALMVPPRYPRLARAARENALCEINKKLGGVLR